MLRAPWRFSSPCARPRAQTPDRPLRRCSISSPLIPTCHGNGLWPARLTKKERRRTVTRAWPQSGRTCFTRSPAGDRWGARSFRRVGGRSDVREDPPTRGRNLRRGRRASHTDDEPPKRTMSLPSERVRIAPRHERHGPGRRTQTAWSAAGAVTSAARVGGEELAITADALKSHTDVLGRVVAGRTRVAEAGTDVAGERTSSHHKTHGSDCLGSSSSCAASCPM